ncbi:acetate--CoA ligase [Blastopirellula sp. JC732]|uniref:Acetyl-coenzyme A synthetase n=1 Tax=Blastopirellula sediminis TaxID=2894196 RepID=A0A9X1MID0_9BACT|nr:acetate--CoA ligase [Blastopirellula sediminis]MCC9604260.1 acetate--CoA ligase [Blastopirellula sediminis]MCC9626780.1 acetate--CoA ligase [Blastopirellula sediminis]
MANESSGRISNVMQEARVFPPTPEFQAKAAISSMEQYQQMWDEAKADPPAFWDKIAKTELHWFEPYRKTLEWNEPFAKWFVDGKTNASYNCLDRHLSTPRRDKPAIIWEGEPGDTRTLTYAELHREVCRFANGLKSLGVQQGDVVSIYMPMTPELAIAMLACARIGAIHSVIFAGFSAEAIADRNHDASARVMLTADGAWRRGKELSLKATVDEALAKSPTVEKCIVLKRIGNEINMQEGRDIWWNDLIESVSDDCPAEPFDSETPLFILYTSGSTGKPKGIKHTTAGYNLYAKQTFEWVFDHRDDDIYWCTADCGWITGHSYVVYGPMSAGATCVMYEGAPNFPDEGRFWELIEKYKVTILYTAPTAIRAFIKWGDEWVDKHDISSLRLLGTVGEGINPEAWMWYHEKIGASRCPIVDTWWQTETGGIMMSPLPGAIPTKPGSCTKPLPGVIPGIFDENNELCEKNQGGKLTITHPWPGMLRGIWGDEARYKQQYWSTVPHCYLAGDNARIDDDGYYWIMGRIDDVINVSGHRLSTIEVESALVSHPNVAESAVVGRPHDIKGQAIAAFVTLRDAEPTDELKAALKQHVRKEIGALAVPDDIRFTAVLPKTRSGKIMRRLLRDIASGKELVGDTSTLEDLASLAKLRDED